MAATHVVMALAVAACGVTEPEQTLSIRPTETVYVVGDGAARVEGEAVMINGLTESVRVHPGCSEDHEGLDKLVDGEWVRVQSDSYGLGVPLCPPATLMPGDSAVLRFVIDLDPIDADWPASRTDIPGQYRLRFSAGRITSSGPVLVTSSEPIELRLASGSN